MVLIMLAVALAIGLAFVACEGKDSTFGSDSDSDNDSDSDSDSDTDADSDSDGDTDTGTEYTGPPIPETCEQAEQATSTVGCLFYAVDLDYHDSLEATQQYAIAVSNPQTDDTANVTIYRGNASTFGWDVQATQAIGPMSLFTFNVPDHHTSSSGTMTKGTYKIESDEPIIAYQFNPVDGATSYLSDASMLIPVPSLSLTYDIVGWKRTDCNGVNGADGTMRPYFTVVAVLDGTEVTIDPIMAPIAGTGVPAQDTPFTVALDEGDVVEVAANNIGDTMSGSRVTSNEGHPIAVFSGQECAYIPETTCCCDHLEEQIPGLRFWGKQMVAARMPNRSTSGTADEVLWQVYASENNTQVSLSASSGVTGLPFTSTTMSQGEIIEFYVGGNSAQPGDFFVEADKPIGVMQYMIGAQNPNASGIGDPAMVYTSPAEQFLPRYVVLVPATWVNDVLVITRHAGEGVLLDGEPLPDDPFIPVASSGYEVGRVPVPDGVHTLASEDEEYGLGVLVVGYDTYDSYAYAGGMGMGEINPVVE